MKKPYTLKLDEEIMEDLKPMAEKENRSVANLIETVLKGYTQLKKNAEEANWLNS